MLVRRPQGSPRRSRWASGRLDGFDGPFDFLLQFHPGCGLRPQVREIRPRGPADREHLIEARLSKGLEDGRLIGMELVAVALADARVGEELGIQLEAWQRSPYRPGAASRE